MLKRLQIRNFRGFNKLKIDQLSGIDLIVGKNNSGKTSLLEAIFYQLKLEKRITQPPEIEYAELSGDR